MDLLEYQAKQLFAQVDIPVLPSQTLYDASDLKNLQIPYPVVLKSQVLASERMKYGGVRFVENTIDAIAVAQSLFNLSIQGEYPQVILAESRYDVENELFLAIIIDYALKKPILLGSAQGGENLELLFQNLHTCVIEEEFSPFYARTLAKKMGLDSNLIIRVSDIIEKMYHLLIQYDLDLVEINPLGINQNGEFMALDGKIRANNYALDRHLNLLNYIDLELNSETKTNNTLDSKKLINIQENYQYLKINIDGSIAIISDNIDHNSLIINAFKQVKKNIDTCYILPFKTEQYWQNNIYNILLKIIQSEKIKTVFVNHSNEDNFIDILLTKITSYYQQQNHERNLENEERVERPTGIREKRIYSKKIAKSSLPQREINWIIRPLSGEILEQKEETIDDLPIKITTSLKTAIELVQNNL